jgi:hypothetical protein
MFLLKFLNSSSYTNPPFSKILEGTANLAEKDRELSSGLDMIKP